MNRIGVLALQGAFIEHIKVLNALGAEAVPVRLPEQIDALDGLIIPGGESTTIGKLLARWGFINDLKERIQKGLPVFGTCAGMILLAKNVIGLEEYSLGVMDIKIRRNAFGRQRDSFEADLPISALGEPPLHAVFIRAPLIESVGPGVEILAQLPDETIVAAREGNIVVSAFHPELTPDDRFHKYFLAVINK
jgi:5'-phosphate synthase pdxT subunit